MDYLSGLAKKATSDEPASDTKENSSNYDFVATAKEIPAKVAGATADLIGAASDYGKLDDTTGIGKFADQAESYVRQYATPVAADAPTTGGDGGAGDYIKKAGEYLSKPFGGDGGVKTEAAPTSEPEGGFGDLAKKAGDFFKTTTPAAEESPTADADGGAGDYVKKAGEYLSKPFGGGDGAEKTEAAPSQQPEGGFGDLAKKAGDFFK